VCGHPQGVQRPPRRSYANTDDLRRPRPMRRNAGMQFRSPAAMQECRTAGMQECRWCPWRAVPRASSCTVHGIPSPDNPERSGVQVPKRAPHTRPCSPSSSFHGDGRHRMRIGCVEAVRQPLINVTNLIKRSDDRHTRQDRRRRDAPCRYMAPPKVKQISTSKSTARTATVRTTVPEQSHPCRKVCGM
jgi:hypothetical protein